MTVVTSNRRAGIVCQSMPPLLLLLLKTTQRRVTQALAIIYELWALARTS